MRPLAVCMAAVVASALAISAWCAESGPALRLISSVDLPGVEGAFDHFGVDVKGNRLFVVDGGNGGSCEVLDGTTYRHIKSIKLADDADALVYVNMRDKSQIGVV